MAGLKDYAYYREFKNLKREIRQKVIRIMPRAHKYPDAIYLKEHLGYIVNLSAAIYETEDKDEKAKLIPSILYELRVITDEIEEQEEDMVISIKTATSIYLKIESIIQQLYRFRSYLQRRESDGSRTAESAVK